MVWLLSANGWKKRKIKVSVLTVTPMTVYCSPVAGMVCDPVIIFFKEDHAVMVPTCHFSHFSQFRNYLSCGDHTRECTAFVKSY